MSHVAKKEIILGIDPGSLQTGFAIITIENENIALINMGVITLQKEDFFKRLYTIYEKIDSLILRYRPTIFCIESPFYGKNIQSMLKLGRAQGVAIACAAKYSLPIHEYSPRQVKQFISGKGSSDKLLLYNILKKQFKFKETFKEFDATDALAIALCHTYFLNPNNTNSISKTSKGSIKNRWSSFLKTKEGKKKIK